MIEDHSAKEKVDPKIIVALISGLVSIISASVPLLNATERNYVLVSAAFLIALVLMGICMFILFQRRLYVGIAALVMLGGAAVSAAFAEHVVQAPATLTYANTTVTVYAGNGERVYQDGAFLEASFVAPSCMSSYQDCVYVADSDRIRYLQQGNVSTAPFPSSRYNVLMIRNLEADLYALAENRQMESGKYSNLFMRIRNGETESVSAPFDVGAFAASVPDFAFSPGGVLWFIRLYDAPGEGNATLEKLTYDRDADRYGPPEWVLNFHYEAKDMKASRMTFDAEGNLYVSVPSKGIILRLGRDEQEFSVFAGVEDEHAFNDPGIFTFSYPTALLSENGVLYVWDNGTVRRISIDGGRAASCDTMAGVTPEALNSGKLNVRGVNVGDSVAGAEVILPADERASLAFNERGALLLSDPDGSFIYQIWEEAD